MSLHGKLGCFSTFPILKSKPHFLAFPYKLKSNWLIPFIARMICFLDRILEFLILGIALNSWFTFEWVHILMCIFFCYFFSFVDSVAHAVSATIRGNDLETIIARRNIMRYLCLTQASRSHGILTSCVIGITKFITFIQILILRDISLRVRKRFPTMQSVVKAGSFLYHNFLP